MRSFLLFVFGIAVMLAPIPLATLAATGSWRAAWEAIRGYAKAMLVILGVAAIMAVALLSQIA
jgi:cytochrome c biogenesis protein CcdA